MNSVHLFGTAGRSPETHRDRRGQFVAKVRMSTCDTWVDQYKKRREKTEWHNLVFWNTLAEDAVNKIKKGAYFGVEGRMETRTEDGITEVIVISLDMPMIPFQERGDVINAR